MKNITEMPTYFLSNTTITEAILQSSKKPYFDKNCHHISKFLNTFCMVSFSITFILGLLGNGLVIWVASFKRAKTVNLIWFLNLAIADFIFDIFLPFEIVSRARTSIWSFGSIMCKIKHLVLSLNLMASITFLVIISIDRCVSVMCPVWSRNHRTLSLAYKVTFTAWLLAVILSAPYPAFFDLEYFQRGSDTAYCVEKYAVSSANFTEKSAWTYDQRRIAMATTRFVSMFLIPFVIIICYGVIALKIKKQKHLATSSRPFKIISAIIVLFFICWFPFHLLPFINRGQRSIKWQFCFSVIGKNLFPCLAYFSSCLNPILYVFIGRNFKDIFKRSLFPMFGSAFNEEPTLRQRDSRILHVPSTDVELNQPGRF